MHSVPPPSSSVSVGYWSAIGAALCSLVYIGAQILEWLGLLGSHGGPESQSTPLGLAILLTPSLLLGSTFIVMMAALHIAAPESRKIFTLAGVAFAIVYATLTGMVYFVQLTLVAPRLATGDTADIAILLFIPYRSFLFAIDLLGYTFMCVATLLAAFGLPECRAARAAKFALLANGLLFPFLAFQMYVPRLIWPAALWAITFPLSALLVAAMFRALSRADGVAARD